MIETLHEFGVETLVDLHQDVLSPYTCGEGMPDWAYLKALDAVGFDRTGDRAFPAPLKLDLPIDEETGYADTRACVQRACVCVCVVAPRGGSALGSCRFERESVASAQRARLLIMLRREERRKRERERFTPAERQLRARARDDAPSPPPGARTTRSSNTTSRTSRSRRGTRCTAARRCGGRRGGGRGGSCGGEYEGRVEEVWDLNGRPLARVTVTHT